MTNEEKIDRLITMVFKEGIIPEEFNIIIREQIKQGVTELSIVDLFRLYIKMY